MMTSAFLSTLSLSAEKNCAQNSGAKRRDDINSLIMTSPVLEGRGCYAVGETSRPEGYGTNDCKVTTVAGLPPRFLRSCWSPSGLVRFANILLRPRFRRKGPHQSGYRAG